MKTSMSPKEVSTAIGNLRAEMAGMIGLVESIAKQKPEMLGLDKFCKSARAALDACPYDIHPKGDFTMMAYFLDPMPEVKK